MNTTSQQEGPSVDESGNASAANAEEMAIDWSDGEQDSAMTNPEMINIDEEDLDEDPVEAHDHSAGAENTVETSVDAGSTRFLALSKCLEGQDFLQILDVPSPFDSDSKFQVHNGGDGDEAPSVRPSLRFSEPWLAITKATHDFLSLEKRQVKLPGDEAFLSHVREQQEWVSAQVEAMQEQQPDKHQAWLEVDRTQQFAKTAPAMSDPGGNMSSPREYGGV